MQAPLVITAGALTRWTHKSNGTADLARDSSLESQIRPPMSGQSFEHSQNIFTLAERSERPHLNGSAIVYLSTLRMRDSNSRS